MKKLYEYLVSDINKYNSDFDYDNRFWIKAVTDLTIDGDFEISADDITWAHKNSHKMLRGEQVYLYTSGDPSNIKYKGSFNIGGDIRGLISESCNRDDKSLSRAFRGSEVIDASQLNMESYNISDDCFHMMFSNCKLLTKAPKLPATKLASKCYSSMFERCKSLKRAPDLPARALADECYSYMFQECTLLIKAPKLPATKLADNCYSNMFKECESLTTAPDLPATTLTAGCYDSMFYKCRSLTQAPELPAKTLASRCYYGMFAECYSMKNPPSSLPAMILSDYCYYGMFMDCSNLQKQPHASIDVTLSINSKYMFKNTKFDI